jgi:integrase
MLARPDGRDHPRPWNKGLLVGQKKPLQPKHVWSIRVRLEIARMWRDLALFNLAIDSKLRACDLVKLRIDEVSSGATVRDRATVVQKKTSRPVQFEITEQTRTSLEVLVTNTPDDWLSISLGALTYPPDSIPGWCIAGSKVSVWNRCLTVHIRCGGQRPLRSIARLATCALSNSC